jgi:hypothetical protein
MKVRSRASYSSLAKITICKISQSQVRSTSFGCFAIRRPNGDSLATIDVTIIHQTLGKSDIVTISRSRLTAAISQPKVSRRLEVDQVKYGGHAFRTSSPLQSLDGLLELIRVDLMPVGRTVQWEFLDEKLPLDRDYASCQDHVLVAIPHGDETVLEIQPQAAHDGQTWTLLYLS